MLPSVWQTPCRLVFETGQKSPPRCRWTDACRPQACLVHLSGPWALQIVSCMESSADPLAAARPVSVDTHTHTEAPPAVHTALTSPSCCPSVSSCSLPPSPGPPSTPV